MLRPEMHLTGPNCKCGQGICGACTEACVGGMAVRSCKAPLKVIAGKEIVTAKGLAATAPKADAGAAERLTRCNRPSSITAPSSVAAPPRGC